MLLSEVVLMLGYLRWTQALPLATPFGGRMSAATPPATQDGEVLAPAQSMEQNGLLRVLIFDIRDAAVAESTAPRMVGRLNTLFNHKCQRCCSGYGPACLKVVQL